MMCDDSLHGKTVTVWFPDRKYISGVVYAHDKEILFMSDAKMGGGTGFRPGPEGAKVQVDTSKAEIMSINP